MIKAIEYAFGGFLEVSRRQVISFRSAIENHRTRALLEKGALLHVDDLKPQVVKSW
jgi:hypothetical protein